jgi:hypothetical protein
MNAPVLFLWKDESGIGHQGGGFTRDISSNGVFVFCSANCPPAGSDIAMEIAFPPLEDDVQGLQIKAQGRVVRVDQTEGPAGFAAATDLGLPNGGDL